MIPDTRMRRDALDIFRASLRAADPKQAILRQVRVEGDRLTAGGKRYDLSRFRRIFVVGAGRRARPWPLPSKSCSGSALTAV